MVLAATIIRNPISVSCKYTSESASCFASQTKFRLYDQTTLHAGTIVDPDCPLQNMSLGQASVLPGLGGSGPVEVIPVGWKISVAALG